MGDLRSGAPILSPEQTALPAALNGQYYVKLSLLLRSMESGSIREKAKHLPQLERSVESGKPAPDWILSGSLCVNKVWMLNLVLQESDQVLENKSS